ncbi:MAG TPA: hypothetical protein VHW66_07135 [Stellaceae bacterium]|jgi:hypothetical protein|nr:hypothetical protein [Stellaceae bacterium]
MNAAGAGITAAEIEADLTNSATAAQTQTLLLPFIMADLSNILSQKTAMSPDQAYFVQQVESFIQAQRQAAAIQAQNDYDAWYKATVAQEVQEIETVPPGVAQVEMSEIIASNPPIPPPSLLTSPSSVSSSLRRSSIPAWYR